MSFSADEMNLMGSTNNHWGVCGFTSTFYSMSLLSGSPSSDFPNIVSR
jgi:hypothetical protein